MVVCHKQESYCFWGQKVNIGQRSTTKEEFVKSSIFIQLTWNLKMICISGHWIQPPILFEVNIGKKVNIGWISKIVNFLPIHLKFEEELHIWSMNSTSNYFWGQICFMDFARIVLCNTFSILPKFSARLTRRRCRAEQDTCKIHETNLASKIIGGWIQWPNVQILFKFQLNWMNIDKFSNSAYVDLLVDVDLKKNWWLNSVTWNINPLQI